MANKNQAKIPRLELSSIYSVVEVALMLKRTVPVVRNLCNRGEIRAQKDGKGWMIGGWAVRDYVSGVRDLGGYKLVERQN